MFENMMMEGFTQDLIENVGCLVLVEELATRKLTKEALKVQGKCVKKEPPMKKGCVESIPIEGSGSESIPGSRRRPDGTFTIPVPKGSGLDPNATLPKPKNQSPPGPDEPRPDRSQELPKPPFVPRVPPPPKPKGVSKPEPEGPRFRTPVLKVPKFNVPGIDIPKPDLPLKNNPLIRPPDHRPASFKFPLKGVPKYEVPKPDIPRPTFRRKKKDRI